MDLIKELGVADLSNFSDIENGVYLVSYGGIPISIKGDKVFHGLHEIKDSNYFNQIIKLSIGASGLLTYDNKGGHSVEEIGEICQKLGHLWCHRWMTIGLLFKNYSQDVEKTFLRDTKFYESWSLIKGSECNFVFNGTLYDFKHLTKKENDKDFDFVSRKAFSDINSKFEGLWKYKSE